MKTNIENSKGAVSEATKQLIQDGLKYSAEYDDALSSHLPMALIALDKIGADEGRVIDFNNHYIKTLELKNTAELVIDKTNWKSHLGQHKYNAEYCAFFSSEVTKHGVKNTLKMYIDELMPGLAGGAFHPMIRLAYALEVSSAEEVVEALASWCMAYMKLGEINANESVVGKNLQDIFNILKTYEKAKKLRPKISGLFNRVQVIGTNEYFVSTVSRIDKEADDIKSIAALVIKTYLASKNNFTALHMVTATHGLRVINSYLGRLDIPESFLCALASAYIDAGTPDINDSFVPNDIFSWDEITKKAMSSNNDHDIKFIHTCMEESDVHGSKEYRMAATKRIFGKK